MNPENAAQYWYYDSNETPLYLKQDTSEEGGGYYLDSTMEGTEKNRSRQPYSINEATGSYGFFPFNQHAADMFTSTTTVTVLNCNLTLR